MKSFESYRLALMEVSLKDSADKFKKGAIYYKILPGYWGNG